MTLLGSEWSVVKPSSKTCRAALDGQLRRLSPHKQGCFRITQSVLVCGSAVVFEGFLNQRVAGGADQAAIVVGDDLDRHVFED